MPSDRDRATFRGLLAASDWRGASEYLSTDVRAALPPAALADTWQKVEQQAGEFRSITGTRQTVESQFVVQYVRCQFASAELDVKLAFSRDRRIAGLYFVASKP